MLYSEHILTAAHIPYQWAKYVTSCSCHVLHSWRLQLQNERCQMIKAHRSSGEITGKHFQSLEYLVQKCVVLSDLVAQLSVPNS